MPGNGTPSKVRDRSSRNTCRLLLLREPAEAELGGDRGARDDRELIGEPRLGIDPDVLDLRLQDPRTVLRAVHPSGDHAARRVGSEGCLPEVLADDPALARWDVADEPVPADHRRGVVLAGQAAVMGEELA